MKGAASEPYTARRTAKITWILSLADLSVVRSGLAVPNPIGDTDATLRSSVRSSVPVPRSQVVITSPVASPSSAKRTAVSPASSDSWSTEVATSDKRSATMPTIVPVQTCQSPTEGERLRSRSSVVGGTIRTQERPMSPLGVLRYGYEEEVSTLTAPTASTVVTTPRKSSVTPDAGNVSASGLGKGIPTNTPSVPLPVVSGSLKAVLVESLVSAVTDSCRIYLNYIVYSSAFLLFFSIHQS